MLLTYVSSSIILIKRDPPSSQNTTLSIQFVLFILNYDKWFKITNKIPIKPVSVLLTCIKVIGQTYNSLKKKLDHHTKSAFLTPPPCHQYNSWDSIKLHNKHQFLLKCIHNICVWDRNRNPLQIHKKHEIVWQRNKLDIDTNVWIYET